MSELFMECVEEELEPWQKQVSEVHSVEEDDDEPIFVGVLSHNQKNSEPNAQLTLTKSAAKEETKPPNPQTAPVSSQIMMPLNMAGNIGNTPAPTLTTVTPQPVIVNNQGFIVTSPQLVNNSGFITSLGPQYAPGTSFAIVAGGQQQIFQQINPGTVIPGAVHRPQVQQISNNIVTLSHVQSPTVYSTQPNQLQPNQPTAPTVQAFPVPTKAAVNAGLTGTAENGIIKKKCSRCQEEFTTAAALKVHHMTCCTNLESKAPQAVNMTGSKRIMLVSDFYYGQFEGDVNMEVQRTNTTFKCQSCLKILKNNIRFMNHMKHHLELEKQNSESWESHTTCQHCYRQYMTPFQLQCHIESAHSSIESSTNCKICELAFESEQVLLEHMKDNHKPGEMPYVCQVCNYRSSFFSDVETHFRTVHENTKDLLCPFCLRVLKTSHMYMQHYMKHQKKGIHRCGKCRLNFLTYKDKLEHRTHFHKTFRKPRALEGLPPGTKVTIRASISGKMSVPPTYSDRSAVTITPEMQSSSPPLTYPVRLFKSKHNMSGAARGKMSQTKRKDARTTKHNLSLRNLRFYREGYICIECNTQVDDFFSHFPMISNCGACKYRTSCKIAIGNHMIKFHSTVSKNRYMKKDNKKHLASVKFTLVCLNCDLVDASGGDMMTRHLSDRPNHVCRVIQEKGDVKAKDRLQVNMVQPSQVLYFGAIPSLPTLKEMDVKPPEKAVGESFAVDESQRNLQEGDQEKLCPISSSVSTTDVAADVTDEPMADEPALNESACVSGSPVIPESESV